jgi:hypothetical protein
VPPGSRGRPLCPVRIWALANWGSLGPPVSAELNERNAFSPRDGPPRAPLALGRLRPAPSSPWSAPLHPWFTRHAPAEAVSALADVAGLRESLEPTAAAFNALGVRRPYPSRHGARARARCLPAPSSRCGRRCRSAAATAAAPLLKYPLPPQRTFRHAAARAPDPLVRVGWDRGSLPPQLGPWARPFYAERQTRGRARDPPPCRRALLDQGPPRQHGGRAPGHGRLRLVARLADPPVGRRGARELRPPARGGGRVPLAARMPLAGPAPRAPGPAP